MFYQGVEQRVRVLRPLQVCPQPQHIIFEGISSFQEKSVQLPRPVLVYVEMIAEIQNIIIDMLVFRNLHINIANDVLRGSSVWISTESSPWTLFWRSLQGVGLVPLPHT